MSELDGFDELELDLTSAKDGSARRIRAGVKFGRMRRERMASRPKWQRQLTAEKIAVIRRDRKDDDQ